MILRAEFNYYAVCKCTVHLNSMKIKLNLQSALKSKVNDDTDDDFRIYIIVAFLFSLKLNLL